MMKKLYIALLLSIIFSKAFGEAPVIVSFSPAQAAINSTVTITGTNLSGVTSVKFGGQPAQTFTILSDSMIKAKVGNGGSGEVSVSSADGTATLDGFTFSSALSSFSPATGTTGSVIRIKGTYFSDVTEVKFGAKPASSFTLIDPTTIEAVVGEGSPASSSGTIQIVVVAAGKSLPRSGFKFIGITGFSPSSAGLGETVNLTTSNLTNVTSVKFGGVEAASFTVNSPTSITAVVGNGTSGSISVTTPEGTSALPDFQFIQAAALAINNFGPSSAAKGSAITITGTNFTGVNSVKFGGVEASSFSIESDNTIKAVVADGASGDVVVSSPSASVSKAGFTFISSPSISSFSPTIAYSGASVTITGSGFNNVSSVSFGGTPATSFVVNSPTSITVQLNAAASGKVSVTTPAGTAEADGFSYLEVPDIIAQGSTTFSTGGSVVLSASTGGGFTYQWSRNGVDILGAKSVDYTAVSGGSYTVSLMIGSTRITSAPIIINSIFTLNPDNFRIVARDESCKGSNNGSIEINAEKYLKYSVRVLGEHIDETYPFSLSKKIENLSSGKYKLVLSTEEDKDFEQLFDVLISEPQDLSVYSSIKEDKLVLQLNGGSVYKVTLNNKSFVTTENQLSLDLQKGNNTLSVRTDKDCQGIIEKSFSLQPQPLAYPNPFEKVLNVNLGFVPVSKVHVLIQSMDGRVVYKGDHQTSDGTLSLQPEGLASGFYLLKLQADKVDSVIKILKK